MSTRDASSRQTADHFLGEVPAARAEQLLLEWVNSRDAGTDGSERVKIATRLMAHFPETFGLTRAVRPALLHLSSLPDPTDEQLDQLQHLDERLVLVDTIKSLLRRVWQSADHRHRQWFVFKVREAHHRFLHRPPTQSMKGRVAYGTIRIETDPETGDPIAYPADPPRKRNEADYLADRRRRRQEFLSSPNWAGESDETIEVDVRTELQPPDLNAFERVMFHFQRIADRALRCANPECPAPYFFAKKKNQRYCGSACSAFGKREQDKQWWRRNRGKHARQMSATRRNPK